MFKRFTDSEIIAAFRSGGEARERAWEYVYKTWSREIIDFIYPSNAEEVKEALHEVAIPFEMMVRRQDFTVTNSLFYYFRKCVYYQWLNTKEKEKRNPTSELDESFIRDFSESIESEIINSELRKEVYDSLTPLGERCKTILLLFFNKTHMKEIAKSMGFRNAQVAKNEKMKCMKKYEEYLRDNPSVRQHLKEIMEHLK